VPFPVDDCYTNKTIKQVLTDRRLAEILIGVEILRVTERRIPPGGLEAFRASCSLSSKSIIRSSFCCRNIISMLISLHKFPESCRATTRPASRDN